MSFERWPRWITGHHFSVGDCVNEYLSRCWMIFILPSVGTLGISLGFPCKKVDLGQCCLILTSTMGSHTAMNGRTMGNMMLSQYIICGGCFRKGLGEDDLDLGSSLLCLILVFWPMKENWISQGLSVCPGRELPPPTVHKIAVKSYCWMTVGVQNWWQAMHAIPVVALRGEWRQWGT